MKDYLCIMRSNAPSRLPLRIYAFSALGVCALAASAGLAFAGWMEHAPAILMTLTEQGMAWCF